MSGEGAPEEPKSAAPAEAEAAAAEVEPEAAVAAPAAVPTKTEPEAPTATPSEAPAPAPAPAAPASAPAAPAAPSEPAAPAAAAAAAPEAAAAVRANAATTSAAPTVPEPSDPLRAKMQRMLKGYMTHGSLNRDGLFNKEIDPVLDNCLDYYTIVKHPMNLGKVLRNLNSGLYDVDPKKFSHDITLVFNNAIRYHSPPRGFQLVNDCAQRLLHMFQEDYRNLMEKDHGSVYGMTMTSLQAKLAEVRAQRAGGNDGSGAQDGQSAAEPMSAELVQAMEGEVKRREALQAAKNKSKKKQPSAAAKKAAEAAAAKKKKAASKKAAVAAKKKKKAAAAKKKAAAAAAAKKKKAAAAKAQAAKAQAAAKKAAAKPKNDPRKSGRLTAGTQMEVWVPSANAYILGRVQRQLVDLRYTVKFEDNSTMAVDITRDKWYLKGETPGQKNRPSRKIVTAATKLRTEREAALEVTLPIKKPSAKGGKGKKGSKKKGLAAFYEALLFPTNCLEPDQPLPGLEEFDTRQEGVPQRKVDRRAWIGGMKPRWRRIRDLLRQAHKAAEEERKAAAAARSRERKAKARAREAEKREKKRAEQQQQQQQQQPLPPQQQQQPHPHYPHHPHTRGPGGMGDYAQMGYQQNPYGMPTPADSAAGGGWPSGPHAGWPGYGAPQPTGGWGASGDPAMAAHGQAMDGMRGMNAFMPVSSQMNMNMGMGMGMGGYGLAQGVGGTEQDPALAAAAGGGADGGGYGSMPGSHMARMYNYRTNSWEMLGGSNGVERGGYGDGASQQQQAPPTQQQQPAGPGPEMMAGHMDPSLTTPGYMPVGDMSQFNMPPQMHHHHAHHHAQLHQYPQDASGDVAILRREHALEQFRSVKARSNDAGDFLLAAFKALKAYSDSKICMRQTLLGLVVKQPWLDCILRGTKIYELRANACTRRGPVAIMDPDSRHIMGVADIVDVHGPFSLNDLSTEQMIRRHNMPVDYLRQCFSTLRSCYAWELCCARRIEQPIPFTVPQGVMLGSMDLEDLRQYCLSVPC